MTDIIKMRSMYSSSLYNLYICDIELDRLKRYLAAKNANKHIWRKEKHMVTIGIGTAINNFIFFS